MPGSWQKYKKARNEVTAALRKAKASNFKKMFDEVKKSSAYWNLINKATCRTERNRIIAPLRRNDGSLALIDKEKAQLMNSYFATIVENLISSLSIITDSNQMDNVNQCGLSALLAINITSIRPLLQLPTALS